MDYDRYFGLSTSSRNYQSTLKSQFDACIDFEDIEEDEEEVKGEYPCPFCSEDFDFVGLCCHIDEEHPVEAKSGVFPVGMDMVGHITTQHGNISNSWHRLKPHNGDSHATILSSRKESQNGRFQSLLARSSSSSIPSSKMTTDPWLSFIYNTPTADVSESIQPDTVTGERADHKSFYEKTSEINVQQSSLSDKDHREKAKRCEFVQGLLLSTIMDDRL